MSSIAAKSAGDGSAYAHQPGVPDHMLTEVGRGTPCGELLRRYWHPVSRSDDVTTRPKKLLILGEELILFRTGDGTPGLLYPRCVHRGTSLFYGKVDANGIRCCYHGWKFGVEGHCTHQACEPDGGRHRDRIRQPWYPVQEQYGLVWAYLGPPDKKPILPRYDILEDLGADEKLVAHVGSFGSTQDHSFQEPPYVPYNWSHMVDNIMDPMHVQVLHSTFSVVQFVPQFALMPTVDFFRVENGVCYSAVRSLEDGQRVDRVSTFIVPNIMSTPSIELLPGRSRMMGWIVPADDTHFFQVMLIRTPISAPDRFRPVAHNNKYWHQYTEADHQDVPQDFEAQAGQGPMTLHSEEHLATSDRGIVMLRRFLKEQMRVVASGGDPIGTQFDAAKAVVSVTSGNFFSDEGSAG